MRTEPAILSDTQDEGLFPFQMKMDHQKAGSYYQTVGSWRVRVGPISPRGAQ